MRTDVHESFSRGEPVKPGSDRSFGITIAVVLLLWGAIEYWHGGWVWPWLGGVAAALLAAAMIAPAVLKPLNRLWFRFGLLLHNVVNPLVMALLFFVAVVPTGLILRAMGKDVLRLRREPDSDTYWIARQPPGPAPESMKDQF